MYNIDKVTWFNHIPHLSAHFLKLCHDDKIIWMDIKGPTSLQF